jgi:hypothetical protein
MRTFEALAIKQSLRFHPPLTRHLNVAGAVTLLTGAVLELDFINAFAPKTGDTFDFLTSGTSITAADILYRTRIQRCIRLMANPRL